MYPSHSKRASDLLLLVYFVFSSLCKDYLQYKSYDNDLFSSINISLIKTIMNIKTNFQETKTSFMSRQPLGLSQNTVNGVNQNLKIYQWYS